MSESTKGPIQAHRSHDMRFSDSTMYDERCHLCGLTDNYPEALALPCTQDTNAAAAVVAQLKFIKAGEIKAKTFEDRERLKNHPQMVALNKKFDHLNSRKIT